MTVYEISQTNVEVVFIDATEEKAAEENATEESTENIAENIDATEKPYKKKKKSRRGGYSRKRQQQKKARALIAATAAAKAAEAASDSASTATTEEESSSCESTGGSNSPQRSCARKRSQSSNTLIVPSEEAKAAVAASDSANTATTEEESSSCESTGGRSTATTEEESSSCESTGGTSSPQRSWYFLNNSPQRSRARKRNQNNNNHHQRSQAYYHYQLGHTPAYYNPNYMMAPVSSPQRPYRGKKNSVRSNMTPHNLTKERQDLYLALDCEMVGVGGNGSHSALARVTLIDWHGNTVMDELVKPQWEVTDYRTFVSGITKDMLDEAKMDFATCQKLVLRHLEGKILVGHALKNDLGVLGITHPWHMIRDTAKFSPFMQDRHNDGVLWPRSLKLLSKEFLGREVQVYGRPHCPKEDALAALDLYRTVWPQWEQFQWEQFMQHERNRAWNIQHQQM